MPHPGAIRAKGVWGREPDKTDPPTGRGMAPYRSLQKPMFFRCILTSDRGPRNSLSAGEMEHDNIFSFSNVQSQEGGCVNNVYYTTMNHKFVCAQCYDLLTFRIDHTSTMSSALGIRHYYVLSLGPCGRSV